ncbi:MAG TPA: heparinase II/III-family protein, partial [Gemmatimonadales bacterium]|nr:heparinase II/III-family protein [Gemmatimonadales bacterium]
LLGVEQELATLDWRGAPVSPLWTYHLHYLDWAVDLAWALHLTGGAAYRETLVQLLDRWEEGTREGGRAWEPYPHASRTLNVTLLLALTGEALGADRRARLARALGAYVAVAERQLERHLEGNHLWRDVAAWVVAGHLLDGARWDGERRRALEWWERVRRDQLLADGGHEERSPLYHALALSDLAMTLLVLPEGAVGARVRADAARMLPPFQVLLRPDGSLHHFNDSAARDDLDPAFIVAMLRSMGLSGTAAAGPFHLPETGYAGMVDAARGDRLIMDIGLPAPRHQPGHLHCDLLSFELDRAGHPFVVNGGVSGYEGDPLRAYFRGTTSHSTVQVGPWDQSELWGTFRVARMAAVDEQRSGLGADGVWACSATMRPYAPAGVRHRRTVSWRPGELSVTDAVQGGTGEPCRVFLHFAPDVELRRTGPLRFEAGQGGRRSDVTWEGVTSVEMHRGDSAPPLGWYARRFGEVVPSAVLVAEFAAPAAAVRCRITELASA